MAAIMERRVVIAYTGLVNKTSGEQECSTHDLDGHVFHLRHPKTGAKACYMLLNAKLQELHWFKQSYASWFIGDSVCEEYHKVEQSVVECCGVS
ncbi:hypothetical protein CBR_g23991 [Chara braunii]|uniref:Rnh202 triple barrel domain-containing protein n=1 Tax=Chara braunii TaxID=69332 RepID=A0A388L5G8_CHABU|nr:hypothetical protein CBR_g23991 [Chara braunii]|eukprot:GBG77546.1 hypothetical protein CBR_g23991 [Chara braunii]